MNEHLVDKKLSNVVKKRNVVVKSSLICVVKALKGVSLFQFSFVNSFNKGGN